MSLIFSLIMTNFDFQLSLIVFLLDLFNFIHKDIFTFLTSCCSTCSICYMGLWSTLFLLWATSSFRNCGFTYNICLDHTYLWWWASKGLFCRWKLWLQPEDYLIRCIDCTFNQGRIFWINSYNISWMLYWILLFYCCLLGIKALLKWCFHVVRI